ncbi:MAG: MFS transporter [Clostridia bacterium]|nr:MFS transporter [Clostridia bacterium]
MASSKYLSTKIAGYVGFFVQAIVNNFLPILFIALQDVYKMSYARLAFLIAVNFGAQIIVDSIAPKVVALIGYRKAAVLAQFAAFLGLALLSLLPNLISPYVAIIICIIIYATGSGLTEVILSPMIEMLPTRNKSGNMALLHSFYCWGQAATVLLTTAAVYIFGFKNWFIIPLIWSVVPFINMFSFLKVPIVEPDPSVKTATFFELLKNKRFIIYMLLMFCAGASEIAMAEWASIFAQNALGVSKAVGDMAGPCAFAIFMGFGRVIYAKFSKRISFEKLLIGLNAFGVVCYLFVAICQIPLVSLVFCALCGLTVSVSWPGIYSLGASQFKNGGAVMFGAFAMCGDFGCAFGPWLIGILADKFSLNLGFGVASVFSALIVVCGFYLLKNKDCKN